MDSKRLFYEISRIAAELAIGGRAANDILDLVYKVNSSQKDLDKQVEEAVQSLTTSTDLISRLENSLEERAEKLGKLKAEYERVSKLAELTEDQSAAVAKTLEDTLGRGQVRERWIGFGISVAAGLLIFVFGVFASDAVKGIPNMIWNDTIQEVQPNPDSNGSRPEQSGS